MYIYIYIYTCTYGGCILEWKRNLLLLEYLGFRDSVPIMECQTEKKDNEMYSGFYEDISMKDLGLGVLG